MKHVWSTRSERLEGGRVLRFALERDGGPVSFAQVLPAWQDDAEFRAFFSDTLANAPFNAFRWETPLSR